MGLPAQLDFKRSLKQAFKVTHKIITWEGKGFNNLAWIWKNVFCFNSSIIFKFLPLIGGIEKLVLLLSSNVEHVLVNVVNALRILCEKDPENQKVIGDSNAIPTIIELIGMFIRLVNFSNSLFHHSFIHSSIYSFTHSFIHFFIHSFTFSFIHSFTHSFIHSLIQSFIYSSMHAFFIASSGYKLPNIFFSFSPFKASLFEVNNQTMPICPFHTSSLLKLNHATDLGS